MNNQFILGSSRPITVKRIQCITDYIYTIYIYTKPLILEAKLSFHFLFSNLLSTSTGCSFQAQTCQHFKESSHCYLRWSCPLAIICFFLFTYSCLWAIAEDSFCPLAFLAESCRKIQLEDGINMNWDKIRETTEEWGVRGWHAVIHGATKSQRRLSD